MRHPIFNKDKWKRLEFPNDMKPDAPCLCKSWKSFRNCHMFECLWVAFKDTWVLCPDDLCFCWSWLKYDECCKISQHPSWLSIEEYNKQADMVTYSRCKAPWIIVKSYEKFFDKCVICWKDAINSHTISKSWMKKVFNSDYCAYAEAKNYEVKLKKTPIKLASALKLWCKEHDNDVFDEIDNWVDLNNNHHLNLLAYRAITREYRLLCYSVKCSYDLYFMNWWFELCDHLIDTYVSMKDMYRTMTYIFNWFQSKTWTWLKHKIYNLWKINPIFSSSSVKWILYTKRAILHPVLLLTIYTDINNCWYCIFSYNPFENLHKKYFRMLDKLYKDSKFKDHINELLWVNYENMVCDESYDWVLMESTGFKFPPKFAQTFPTIIK